MDEAIDFYSVQIRGVACVFAGRILLRIILSVRCKSIYSNQTVVLSLFGEKESSVLLSIYMYTTYNLTADVQSFSI